MLTDADRLWNSACRLVCSLRVCVDFLMVYNIYAVLYIWVLFSVFLFSGLDKFEEQQQEQRKKVLDNLGSKTPKE